MTMTAAAIAAVIRGHNVRRWDQQCSCGAVIPVSEDRAWSLDVIDHVAAAIAAEVAADRTRRAEPPRGGQVVRADSLEPLRDLGVSVDVPRAHPLAGSVGLLLHVGRRPEADGLVYVELELLVDGEEDPVMLRLYPSSPVRIER